MTRKEKFWSEEYKGLVHDQTSLRFATNETVATYRAEKLSCGHLIEIGAGIGFQTIAFARTCKKVTAIELDTKRVRMLKANLAKLQITNVTILEGDALDQDLIAGLEKADWVFSDPERAAEEPERSLDRLRPSPAEVMEGYQKIAQRFCFEAPPQIEDIPAAYEKEYISLHHKLNRLHLYSGSASTGTTRVVLLPDRVELAEQKRKVIPDGMTAKRFLFEVDAAVEKAGMIDSLPVDAEKLDGGNRTLLTSDRQLQNPFLTGYRVLARTDGDGLLPSLSKMKAKQVIIKYPIDTKEYGQQRRAFEKAVQEGERALHLFKVMDRFLITERV